MWFFDTDPRLASLSRLLVFAVLVWLIAVGVMLIACGVPS